MACLNLWKMKIFFCGLWLSLNKNKLFRIRNIWPLPRIKFTWITSFSNFEKYCYHLILKYTLTTTSYSNFVKYCHSLSKPLFLSFKGCIMTCLLWGLNHIMYACADFYKSFHHQESIFLISTQVAVYASNCINYKGLFHFLLI